MTNPPPHTATLRILDAAMNRAAEGLRVVEDFARMVLDDTHLSRLAKELRHDLTTAGQSLPPADRHAARDTLGDVGTRIATKEETERDDAWQVAAASFQRTAQALRSLEEYGKLVDISLAAECESLRYRLYTLEKAMSLTTHSQAGLHGMTTYALVDGGKNKKDFGETLALATAAGFGVLQLRDKRLNDRQLLAYARQLRQQTEPLGVLSIINDRPDIAVAADADGVHLGQDDMPVAVARKIVGPRKLIGVSTHNLAQARQAVLDGANYIGAGPTFPSRTKRFDEFPGLEYLRQVATEISLPTFAIGGIHKGNVEKVFATGISRIAMSAVKTGAGLSATEGSDVGA